MSNEPTQFNAPRDCEHHWEPVSLDEGRCWFICRGCASHTYMTTQWIGYRLYGSEDAAVQWVGDDPIPANNKRITSASSRVAWAPQPDDPAANAG